MLPKSRRFSTRPFGAGVLFCAFFLAFSCRLYPENYHTQAAIFSETKALVPGRPFWIAVQLKMNDGWHTYWKNQGDSGLATAVDWQLPEGFSADPALWPAPKKFGDSNVTNYGYDSEAILLFKITPPAAIQEGDAVPIRASVRWMECMDICVPGKAELSLDLSVGKTDGGAGANADLFNRARNSIPRHPAGWFFRARYRRNRILFSMARPAKGAVSDAYFFSETRGQLDAGAPQKLTAHPKSYSLELWCGTGFKKSSRRLKGVLSYKDGSGAPGAVSVSVPISNR